MEWFNSHIEVIFYTAGAVLTFTIWNVNQGWKNKETAKDLADHKKESAKDLEEYKKEAAKKHSELKEEHSVKFANYDAEIKSIRNRQDTVEKGLTDELRKIGEKLAHIEGYLTAKRQTKRS